MKPKTRYTCQHCQATLKQWQGQCPHCQQWGTVVAVQDRGEAGGDSVPSQEPVVLGELSPEQSQGVSTGSRTVDELLGQGIMPGSALLLGGEPGVGKSTFLLQLLGSLCASGRKALYVSGEESLSQLRKRADRLSVLDSGLMALNSQRVEDVAAAIRSSSPPSVVVVDSIQTMTSAEVDGIPGSVSQVRSSASRLVEEGKKHNVALILVGHVTKEGQIAGPKLLEHMVDAVLYMEGDKEHLFRMLRVVKNRFGPASNMLVLKMVDKGLQIVRDPSTFFLQARDPSLSGTAVVMALEGQRPFAVEVQALVTRSYLAMPRRTALGVDTNRLNLLLAIMEKKLHLNLGQTDIYAKIGGGLKLEEPSLDVALVAAVLSSFYDRPLPEKAVFWGEVDLSGQVRPVMGQEVRLRQARQLGYDPVFCPIHSEGQASSGPNQGVGSVQDLLARLKVGG
jgi:DNA repair protein RadA/Sms